jgi:hypothetical protein
LRIDIVGCNGVTAFGVEPGIDARSGTEVEQQTAGRRNAQNETLKRGAGEAVRF